MPRETIDYSKCIIYKIVCNDETVLDCYVGHTTNFVKRKHGHKTNCNNENARDYNIKLYQMIRDHGGWLEWQMIPICEYPCENSIQARIKEEEYRIELQAGLNTCKCFGGETRYDYDKSYYETNKGKIAERKKKYYEDNKKEISVREKKKRDEIREQIRTHDKLHYAKNREKIIARKKKYYDENKDKINERVRLRYAQNKLNQTKI